MFAILKDRSARWWHRMDDARYTATAGSAVASLWRASGAVVRIISHSAPAIGRKDAGKGRIRVCYFAQGSRISPCWTAATLFAAAMYPVLARGFSSGRVVTRTSMRLKRPSGRGSLGEYPIEY
jgi:hypothetical protein